MDSDNYSSSSSRCSSSCSSLASRKVPPFKPRRIVGDVVRISSSSNVYVNRPESFVATPLVLVNNEDNNNCDKNSVKMVSESLKDSPKIRNKIFEESLESQEISYYIDDFYEDRQSEQEDDSDSFESETETEESIEIRSRHNLDNVPLPLPPNEPNTLEKLAENVKKIRKTISKDFSKSIRRISRRISQPETVSQSTTSLRLSSAREETPADVIHVTNVVVRRNDESKPASLLSRIRRSMSLSAESAPLKFSARNETQRRSTFYLTDTIDIDTPANSTEVNSTVSITDCIPEVTVEKTFDSPSQSVRSSRKLVRPKSPPPPIPIVQKNPQENTDGREKLLHAVPVVPPKNKSPDMRKTWYAETTKLSPKSEDGETPVKPKTYTNVLQELSFKFNGSSTNCSNIEDVSMTSENESTYNNQSIRSFGSSKTDESSLVMDPVLEFLQDEPLYQFYDAARLESIYSGESDFEDDGVYEDVVESNEDIYSKDLDIINQSFVVTRSLWCEVPEVKKSAVLSQLSTQQKKLQEAKFEVITSEASYLNSLNVLSNHFVSSFKKSNTVNEKELEILFGKLKGVRNSSKKMLHDLERCWKSNILLDGICDVIQKHAQENFDAYIPYCENQVLINDTLNGMKERSGFSGFLTQLESSSSCHYLSLYSFLMLPMQRITRWPLLVEAILKRLSESDPEYLICKQALVTLSKIVGQCNEAARKKEREVELVKISNTLHFPMEVNYVDIIADNRWLLRSGTLTCLQPRNDEGKVTFSKKFNKLPLTLYLFNDMFLVTKKEREVHTVLHYCHRNFIELRDIDTNKMISRKDINEKFILYLCILENQDGRLVELLLLSPTETDKERWKDVFSPPKGENPDETIYEEWDCPQVTVLHNYNACQPDELSLSRGDVINVLRKMSDGWYNGQRTRDGMTGWFPSNYTVENINLHVRSRNLKERYRVLTFSENYLKSY